MNSNETTRATDPLDGITAAIESAIQQAREQAERIINDAREEAQRIINDARTQADTIITDAQADARAKDDMERASLAIQEHAAALHTLALGLTGHETTPHDNTGNTNGSASDDNAGNADTNDAHAIPPAPPATPPNNATTAASRATATARPTTRRANGTTRKLAPWEQPEEPQSETAHEPEETHASNTASADAKQDATTPQWDAPIVIDAPLQL